NNPDEFECHISPAASSGTVTVTTNSGQAALAPLSWFGPMPHQEQPCGANIPDEAGFDGFNYPAQKPVTPASGNCPPPPEDDFKLRFSLIRPAISSNEQTGVEITKSGETGPLYGRVGLTMTVTNDGHAAGVAIVVFHLH